MYHIYFVALYMCVLYRSTIQEVPLQNRFFKLYNTSTDSSNSVPIPLQKRLHHMTIPELSFSANLAVVWRLRYRIDLYKSVLRAGVRGVYSFSVLSQERQAGHPVYVFIRHQENAKQNNMLLRAQGIKERQTVLTMGSCVQGMSDAR